MTDYDRNSTDKDAPGAAGDMGVPGEPARSGPADTADSADSADAAGEEHRAAFPWPPANGESVLDAWGRTWSGASLRPRQFFASMPDTASLGPAVLYYLSIGIPVAGVQLFWTMVRGSDGSAADATADALGALGEWSPLMGFLFSPVYLLIALIVAAGVTHLLLKLLGGTRGDYGMTTRVFAYAYSPQILGIIPVAGTFAGFVWMVVIAIVGVREAHRTTTGRAAAAVLVPLAFALALVAMAELIAATGRLLDTGL